MTPTTIVLAAAIGGLMGLLGGGGSIVAVPALTYVAHLPPKDAVAASLAIVGVVAAVGAGHALIQRRLPLRVALAVGLSSTAGAYVGGGIGAELPDRVQLSLLAVVMLGAAVALWARAPVDAADVPHPRLHVLAALGAGVGGLTGLVGVGGGFLIVPALVVAAGLSMQRAAAASLFSIALAAGAALPRYSAHASLGWRFIVPFALVASAAALAGSRISERLPQRRLQQAFAITLVVLGSFLITQLNVTRGRHVRQTFLRTVDCASQLPDWLSTRR